MMKTSLLTLAVALGSGAAVAQDAFLTAIHGVPGLPAPVEVRANGGTVTTFDYGEQAGPLTLAAGSYNLEIVLNGNAILQATAPVQAGNSYTAIAHLDASGNPTLSLFDNDLSSLTLPSSRLYVRHTAQAPAVDVVLEQNGATVATLPGIVNGNDVVADVPPGTYQARLNLAGTQTTAFGPVDVVVEDGYGYAIHATGIASDPSFTLQVQRISLAPHVTVVHGIPGLGAPVTVQANGGALFSFDYLEVVGPLVVDAGSYTFDVVLNGNPVLTLSDSLDRLTDITVVAHLDGAGAPQIAAFANDIEQIASVHARITVRHLAAAPAVDAVLSNSGQVLATIPNLTNGNEATADVVPGNFDVELRAAGTSTTAFGPINLRPAIGNYYELIAVGDLNGGSFNVLALQRDLAPAVAAGITAAPGGTTCGPVISAQPPAFDFGEPWELVVTGSQANVMGLVQFGTSITQAGALQLPFDLTALGATGCALQTDALAVLAVMTDGNGELRVPFLVPRALAGNLGPAYFQAATVTTNNSFGWATTEYLELVQ